MFTKTFYCCTYTMVVFQNSQRWKSSLRYVSIHFQHWQWILEHGLCIHLKQKEVKEGNKLINLIICILQQKLWKISENIYKFKIRNIKQTNLSLECFNSTSINLLSLNFFHFDYYIDITQRSYLLRKTSGSVGRKVTH